MNLQHMIMGLSRYLHTISKECGSGVYRPEIATQDAQTEKKEEK